MTEAVEAKSETLLCHRCNEHKALSEFAASRIHHPWRPCRKCRLKERVHREPKPIPTSYFCSKCGIEKDSCLFYLRSRKDGRPTRERADCKECVKKQVREYRQANRQHYRALSKQWRSRKPERCKSHALKTMYGITLEEYDQILIAQNGLCAICRKPPETGGRVQALFVDHDHETDRVRGLLCRQCNFGLGSFQDDPALLDAAVIYLKKES